jgi:hypothetical protein
MRREMMNHSNRQLPLKRKNLGEARKRLLTPTVKLRRKNHPRAQRGRKTELRLRRRLCHQQLPPVV